MVDDIIPHLYKLIRNELLRIVSKAMRIQIEI